MERLTKYFIDIGGYCVDNEYITNIGTKGINNNNPTFVGKAVDKLAEYEDLEEQGKLFIGNRIRRIDTEDGFKRVIEIIKSGYINKSDMKRLTKKFTDGKAYCEDFKVVERLAEYENLEAYGKLLKLICSQEEVEAALKRGEYKYVLYWYSKENSQVEILSGFNKLDDAKHYADMRNKIFSRKGCFFISSPSSAEGIYIKGYKYKYLHLGRKKWFGLTFYELPIKNKTIEMPYK